MIPDPYIRMEKIENNQPSLKILLGNRFITAIIKASAAHWFLTQHFFPIFFQESQTSNGDCDSKNAFQTIILTPLKALGLTLL